MPTDRRAARLLAGAWLGFAKAAVLVGHAIRLGVIALWVLAFLVLFGVAFWEYGAARVFILCGASAGAVLLFCLACIAIEEIHLWAVETREGDRRGER
jgi:hypothetical protein